MKKFLTVTALFTIAVILTSCNAFVGSPLVGTIYTDVKYPVAVTNNSNATKVGSSKATSILGIVATGDASIDKAAKNAGITKIHHVDAHSTNILGIVSNYEIIVYGE